MTEIIQWRRHSAPGDVSRDAQKCIGSCEYIGIAHRELWQLTALQNVAAARSLPAERGNDRARKNAFTRPSLPTIGIGSRVSLRRINATTRQATETTTSTIYIRGTRNERSRQPYYYRLFAVRASVIMILFLWT